MNKIKKMWKEISVFGIVIVAFLGLFVYNKVMYTSYTTLSQEKVESKIKNKESFIVVAGNNKEQTTISYQETMKNVTQKNRSKNLYYVDFSKNKNAATYIKKTFHSDTGVTPQTFAIKKGKIISHRTDILSYSRLLALYDLL